MKQTINKFLIGLLFILGVIIVPTYKVEAAITVTVTASPPTVVYGGGSTISWTSTGATSCSESGGRGGTGTTGSFYVSSLSSNATFNVTCSKPAYCSGTYSKKVDWNGNDLDWVAGTVYDGDGGGCGYCSQRGHLGYRVTEKTDSNLNVDYSWYQPTCVKNTGIGCSGSRWSANEAKIRSAFDSNASCGIFTNSSTCSDPLGIGDSRPCVFIHSAFYCSTHLWLEASCIWNP